MNLFLEQIDLVQLTGYSRKAKQCIQLRRMNIPFLINARGEPLATVSYINSAITKTYRKAA